MHIYVSPDKYLINRILLAFIMQSALNTATHQRSDLLHIITLVMLVTLLCYYYYYNVIIIIIIIIITSFLFVVLFVRFIALGIVRF